MKKLPADNLLTNQLRCEPLTKDNWKHFEELFGEKGACGYCWCMYNRLPKAAFEAGKKEAGNKQSMKELVTTGKPVGMLGFEGDRAIAWCAFAPRGDFDKLKRSRVHKPIDDKAVWSIPCFFIQKEYRRKGISVALLKAVIAYAKANGIQVIEAYPAIPTQEKLPDAFAWIGLYRSFEKAGFTIVDQTSKNRPMVRYYVQQ